MVTSNNIITTFTQNVILWTIEGPTSGAFMQCRRSNTYSKIVVGACMVVSEGKHYDRE